MTPSAKKPSTLLVIVAFGLVYVVWGSTYFFIRVAVHDIPPFIMGATRFIASGLLMLIYGMFTGEKLWDWKLNKHAAISGLFMLFGATGALIWAESVVPSAVAAILVSAAPVWFVLFDASHWKENFKSRSTIVGLIIGFGGVVLLFGEQFSQSLGLGTAGKLPFMALLVFGSMLWSVGSLYSKYKAGGTSSTVNTTWQMLAAGIAFIPFSFLHNEYATFDLSKVHLSSWLAVGYLVIFGSIVAFSAYVWLLQVRPATQVSTYAYVNPVIALLLGVLFGNEDISMLQIGGLVVILGSVLLINLAKYRKSKQEETVTTELAGAE